MKQNSYAIEFDIQLETTIQLHMTAVATLHHSTPYYVVNDFRTRHQHEGSILPELKIRKKKGVWVHLDTEKPTQLSEVVGSAIDALGLPSS